MAEELNFSLNPTYRKTRFLSYIDRIIKYFIYADVKSIDEIGYISKSAWEILTEAQQTTLKNQYFHQGYNVEYDDYNSIYVIKEKETNKDVKESLSYFKDYLSELDNFYIFFRKGGLPHMKVSSIVKRISFIDEIVILAFDSKDEEHTVFSGNRDEVPWLLMKAKVAKQNIEDDAPTIGIWHNDKKNIDTLFIIIEDLWEAI